MDLNSNLAEVNSIITTEQYLDRLLARYSGTFDIYTPYHIGGNIFAAYGYFYSHVEKFILTKNTNMWSSDSYEHILFHTYEQLSINDVEDMKHILLDYVEPKLVLKGEELPPPNHMYSYMTAIFISQKAPDKEVIKAIKRYSYDKGYQMSMRGYSQIQMCLVSLEDEKIYHNFASHAKKKILKTIFKDVKEGKIGFQALCEKQGVKPFVQDVPVI